MPDKTTIPATPPPPVLRARALAKGYNTPRGRLAVLADITLAIDPGEFVSIRGESGAGKTTLLQILGGLDRPDSGELLWNGETLARETNARLARRRARWLGCVFQNYHLVPELTAHENITLAARIVGHPLRDATPDATRLLATVGLAQRATHLPSQLSGGECQRVALARALINNPSLLLADEPTGNLDERTGASIMNLLIELTKSARIALILVTHNTEFAQRATRRFILRHGVLQPA
ncbi:MAG: ABC transporter ATP-binding protein [Puniceicoccales bacterium]|jgi:ABC-type lipoprotein export system ATPase subunit|nr:ABC transporter ATP-binding protein [Puniceicoccales bacterium]